MEVTKKGAAKNTIFGAGKRARGGLERSEAGILPKFVRHYLSVQNSRIRWATIKIFLKALD